MNFYIRPTKHGDGEGVSALRRMPGVFENILGMPSERISRAEDYIAAMDDNTHSFVAVTRLASGEELIIGNAGLVVNGSGRLRHCANVGIMVHKEYQGMHVGQALMETLLDMADNWLMLVRVELTVFQDNERAIALYKKLGFEVEGTRKMGAIRNGRYCDEFSMARIRDI